nr:hypothetical protein [Tanacetum cinerariifolium]
MVAAAQNTNNTTIRKLVHLEQSFTPLPNLVASQAARDAYDALIDVQNEVACLMLVKAFYACKKDEGQSVRSYLLKMKSYLETLERLGYAMPNELGHKKMLAELHAILKLHEKGILKKAKTPAVLAILEGKIQKNKKKKPQGEKGPKVLANLLLNHEEGERVNELVEVGGVEDLEEVMMSVGNQGNVGNQNGNVVNENVQENVRIVLVNGNRVGCSYKEFLACNPKEYDEDFCPSHEMQKLKTELWNHVMVGAGHAAYTNRFHELARLICGMVAAMEPKSMQKAMQISGLLTDEAVRNGSIKRLRKEEMWRNLARIRMVGMIIKGL